MSATGKKTPPGSGAVRDLAAAGAGGYLGRSAAFLTQHGKEKIVAPVLEAASGKTNFAHRLTADWSEAEAFARAAGFPEHGLVVRPRHEDDPRIRKGIAGWQALR